MVFRAFDGVGDHCARLHDKCPVTGLGQEELPGGLPEGAVHERVGVRIFEFSSQFDHPCGGKVQMGVDPGV